MEGYCLKAMKLVHHHGNGYFDWLIFGHESFNLSRESISTLSKVRSLGIVTLSICQYPVFERTLGNSEDLPPYIMCVQCIGGCSVHRGDTMSTSGDIMSTSGDVQYIRGYNEYIGGIP